MKIKTRIGHQIQKMDGSLRYPPPFSASYDKQLSPSFPSSSPSPSGSKISPAVLFIIVILAVLFFISGLLHLLVRFFVRKSSSSASDGYPEVSTSDALQRQLQQLFHLHDSGLDQAFIDSLPVFQYKEIVGAKEPFDCAVCLCEFSEKDKLRLLPSCSHAFHVSCIDTWLLSNSTCPLCRNTLFTAGLSVENPMFDFDDLRDEHGWLGNVGGNGLTSTGRKTAEIEEIALEKSVLPVILGKFRKLNDEAQEAGGETSSSNLDARRCYSMSSYQYVIGQSELRVSFRGHRLGRHPLKAVTENNGNNAAGDMGSVEGKKMSRVSKGESYSVSKIWQWSKKDKFSDPEMGVSSTDNVDLPWTRQNHA